MGQDTHKVTSRQIAIGLAMWVIRGFNNPFFLRIGGLVAMLGATMIFLSVNDSPGASQYIHTITLSFPALALFACYEWVQVIIRMGRDLYRYSTRPSPNHLARVKEFENKELEKWR